MADQQPPSPPPPPPQPVPPAQNIPAPLLPRRYTKHEHQGSTYIQKKNDLYLMCNFTFTVNAHSVLLDKLGNQVFVLSCGNQDDRIFRVPVTYSDLDTLSKTAAKIEKFKSGFDALLHLDVAKTGCLHHIIRSEIEEYQSKNVQNQKEILILDEIGFRKMEERDIYVVGPNQVISVDSDPVLDERLSRLEKLWMGPASEDYR